MYVKIYKSNISSHAVKHAFAKNALKYGRWGSISVQTDVKESSKQNQFTESLGKQKIKIIYNVYRNMVEDLSV